ncbi:MAG: hypothetical protein ACNA71_09120 [Kiritimatiellia bacterium]
MELDEKINSRCSGVRDIISSPRSNSKVLVIPTNEELMIARGVVDTLNHKTADIKTGA